jgi:hypothetical protein
VQEEALTDDQFVVAQDHRFHAPLAVVLQLARPRHVVLLDGPKQFSWPSGCSWRRRFISRPGETAKGGEAIDTLGTENGRDAISAVMADRRIAVDALPQGLGERELALHLFLLQRNDGSTTAEPAIAALKAITLGCGISAPAL